jgi:hypothetical protein
MYTIQDTASVCTLDPATGAPKATGLGPRSANYQVGGGGGSMEIKLQAQQGCMVGSMLQPDSSLQHLGVCDIHP